MAMTQVQIAELSDFINELNNYVPDWADSFIIKSVLVSIDEKDFNIARANIKRGALIVIEFEVSEKD